MWVEPKSRLALCINNKHENSTMVMNVVCSMRGESSLVYWMKTYVASRGQLWYRLVQSIHKAMNSEQVQRD